MKLQQINHNYKANQLYLLFRLPIFICLFILKWLERKNPAKKTEMKKNNSINYIKF